MKMKKCPMLPMRFFRIIGLPVLGLIRWKIILLITLFSYRRGLFMMGFVNLLFGRLILNGNFLGLLSNLRQEVKRCKWIDPSQRQQYPKYGTVPIVKRQKWTGFLVKMNPFQSTRISHNRILERCWITKNLLDIKFFIKSLIYCTQSVKYDGII